MPKLCDRWVAPTLRERVDADSVELFVIVLIERAVVGIEAFIAHQTPQTHKQGRRVPLDGKLPGHHGLVDGAAGDRGHQPMSLDQALPARVERGLGNARVLTGLLQKPPRFLETGLCLLKLEPTWNALIGPPQAQRRAQH